MKEGASIKSVYCCCTLYCIEMQSLYLFPFLFPLQFAYITNNVPDRTLCKIIMCVSPLPEICVQTTDDTKIADVNHCFMRNDSQQCIWNLVGLIEYRSRVIQKLSIYMLVKESCTVLVEKKCWLDDLYSQLMNNKTHTVGKISQMIATLYT